MSDPIKTDPDTKKVVVAYGRYEQLPESEHRIQFTVLRVEFNGERGPGHVLRRTTGTFTGKRAHFHSVEVQFPNAEIRICDDGEHAEREIAWLLEGIDENPVCLVCQRTEERCYCVKFLGRVFTPMAKLRRGVGDWPIITTGAFPLLRCPKCFSHRVRTTYDQRWDARGRWVECTNVCQNCRNFHSWSKFAEAL